MISPSTGRLRFRLLRRAFELRGPPLRATRVPPQNHVSRISKRHYGEELSVRTPDPAKLTPAHTITKKSQSKIATRSLKLAKIPLTFLTDPMKLANHTLSLVQNGEKVRALDMVRQASRDRPCTVSWNHIINNYMRTGHVNTAFQVFNEMRKRAQKPDAHTYTILLRGLVENVNKTPTAVERALSLITALQGPNSSVRASTFHFNAAIEVCAKAHNMDAIYDIAARLPDKGPGAPNNGTYTIVLEAIRVMALRAVPEHQNFSEFDVNRMRADYILQGKRIWADVVQRWRRRTLVMDEMLVDAMGRLLMVGTTRNYDEVLSLVAQTTALARETPEIGDPARQIHLQGGEFDPTQPEENQIASSNALSAPAIMQKKLMESDLDSKKLFSAKPLRSYTIAIPRNRILSILMRACGKMNALEAAQVYWGKITATVAPDLDNFHEYLRVLGRQRGSRLAVELLRQINTPEDQEGFGLQPRPITFRLAMNVCARDGNNHKVLEHARDVLRQLAGYSPVPDPLTGQILVDLLQRRMGQWSAEEMIATMDSLDVLWTNLKHFHAYGSGEVSHEKSLAREVSPEQRLAIARLTQTYYRLISTAMDVYRERLSLEVFQTWNKRLSRNRNKLNRWKAVAREKWFAEESKTGDQRSRSAASEEADEGFVFGDHEPFPKIHA